MFFPFLFFLFVGTTPFSISTCLSLVSTISMILLSFYHGIQTTSKSVNFASNAQKLVLKFISSSRNKPYLKIKTLFIKLRKVHTSFKLRICVAFFANWPEINVLFLQKSYIFYYFLCRTLALIARKYLMNWIITSSIIV